MDPEQTQQNTQYARVRAHTRFIYGIGGAIIFLTLVYVACCRPPKDFPVGTTYTVEEGISLSRVAQDLANHHVVSSPFMFTRLVVALGKENNIQAGDYMFEEPLTMFSVALRLVTGDHGITPVRITIPEGYNVFEIADLARQGLDSFDPKRFIEIAQEGYMFPDTYLFRPDSTEEDVAERMEKNFEEKIATLSDDIHAFGKPLKDVLIIASILEEEARTTESREIISGILWKRLELGMPLQVDVTFKYINGKNTYELSQDDLEIDSPYNTYKYAGLPPTPIANPGLDSLRAAVHPRETPYLYFLSSKEGAMYYAKDFEGHKRNRALYLD